MSFFVAVYAVEVAALSQRDSHVANLPHELVE